MTNKDKIIAAFLVSVGIFSVTQASKYLGTISRIEKDQLFSAAKENPVNILLCEEVHDFTDPKKAA